MTREEANARIAQLIANYKKVQEEAKAEAMALADEHGLTFEWDSTYGSHEQTYVGKGDRPDWNSSDCYNEGESIGWTSSSMGC